jgi:hypothetical protein
VEGRRSIEEGRQAFGEAAEKLAAESGMGINALEREYPDEMNFFGMLAEAKELLLKREPGYKAVMDSIEAFTKGWADETKDVREKNLRQWQGNKIGLYLFDKILDASGSARITPEQAQREGMNLFGLLIEGKVAFMKETADNNSRFKVGSDSDKDFGKATY